jgi:hypothetical protein
MFPIRNARQRHIEDDHVGRSRRNDVRRRLKPGDVGWLVGAGAIQAVTAPPRLG